MFFVRGRSRGAGGTERRIRHEWPRVLPLQAVGRRRRGARLLDDDRSGVGRRPLRRPAGGLGAAARDRSRVRRQRIYASHKSNMFARRSCYSLVRPKRTVLEVCVFLGRAVEAQQVRCCGPRVEVQAAAHDSHPPPRRGRAAHRRLAGRGLRALRRVARIPWPQLLRRLAARPHQSTLQEGVGRSSPRTRGLPSPQRNNGWPRPRTSRRWSEGKVRVAGLSRESTSDGLRTSGRDEGCYDDDIGLGTAFEAGRRPCTA